MDGDLGRTGDQSVVLGRTANFHAAYAISWWEDNDDPCKFELVTRHGYAKGISLGCRKVVAVEQPDDGPIKNPNAVDNPISPSTQQQY